MRVKSITITLISIISALASATAQNVVTPVDRDMYPGKVVSNLIASDSDSVADEFRFFFPDTIARRVNTPMILGNYRPMVFDTFVIMDSLKIGKPQKVDGIKSVASPEAFYWLEDAAGVIDLARHARQRYMVDNPSSVPYNERFLPDPPKKYRAEVNPETAKITLSEEPTHNDINMDMTVDFNRRNWLHSFTGSVQFSQAYVSPNWYQGGNNNLNMIANAVFNVKLNPAFHPKLLFETTVAYKLGLNSAPDDSLRNYSISEDLFQVNSKFGYKAANRWYYSMTGQFKTQFLNNYKKNTTDLKAAFLSPSELNVGVGMTYNYANKPKTFTFDASISPLSWNMKTCINDKVDVKGIDPGQTVIHEFGSSAEGKMKWQMANNITYQARLFMFTDYDYYQGDLENTISFQINRFLSSQIYVHLRYDSSTPRQKDNDWHVWQLKEIFSFGFNYKFSTY